MYRLMIKTHNKTNLKYLCMTSREDWEKYTGSGKKWKRHLKKHGTDISTEVIHETEDYEEFVNVCILTSIELDVVLSEEFANIIPENGYGDGGVGGINNFVLWSQYATQEMKNARVAARRPGQIDNHWVRSERAEYIKDIISKKSIERWDNMTIQERREMMTAVHLGHRRFIEEGGIRFENWKAKLSVSIKSYFANAPFEVISEKNRRNRLNTTPEAAARRKAKIQAVYQTGKHDALYERYKEERKGINNPAAKITYWFGVPYTKREFKKLIKQEGLDKEYVEKMMNTNENCYTTYKDTQRQFEIITCPHCGRDTGGKKHSPFKRWHFDNCKEK